MGRLTRAPHGTPPGAAYPWWRDHPSTTSAAPVGPPAHRPPLPAAVLLANLVVEIGIVVTGGLVRLTGCGLGCPTWPECVPGSFTPTASRPRASTSSSSSATAR